MYTDESENITDEIVKEMEHFERLIQSTLKIAVKTSMKLPNGNATKYFKSIYALTLRKPEKLDGLKMAEHLIQLLDKIQKASQEIP